MRSEYGIDAAKSFTDEALEAYGDIKLKDVPTNILDAASKFEKRVSRNTNIGGLIGGAITARDADKYVNEILKDPTVYMPKEHLKAMARQTVHYVRL